MSRICEVNIKGMLLGETEEERLEDTRFLLKKNPRHCVCCGKELTAEELLGSQGWHCEECWNHLVFDEEGYYCSLHDKDVRYIRIWPLFDSFLQLDNLEDWNQNE